MKRWIIVPLLLFPGLLPASDWVELKNDFVRVKVEKDSGRYILQTVKGNPDNPGDDNKYLSYNDSPPTSFTTIAFNDGSDVYKFGSGDGKFIKKPTVENNTIVTVWSIKDCWVTQTLSFTNSPTTRRKDSLKIAYKVVNRADKVRKVGVRILIDTSLGETDGTPYFLPGVGTVDDEKEFSGSKIPTYWYSFDSLKRPLVRSMGTLKGKMVTSPDRLVFASWKKLDAKPWKYKVNDGSSFRRSLLGARDSAVALYYNTKQITPGYEMKVATLYGMFGTATYTGKVFNLVLGGSSQTTSGDPFNITLNMRNISKLDLTNCRIRLNIPRSVIQPVPDSEGKYSKEDQDIEDFDGGDTKNISWHFKAKDGVKGEYPYSVSVSGFYKGKLYTARANRTLLINQAATKIIDKIPTVDPGSLTNNNTPVVTNRMPVFTNRIPVATNTPFPPMTNRGPLVIRLTNRFPVRNTAPPVLVAPVPVITVKVVTNKPLVVLTTNRIYLRAVTNTGISNTGMSNTGVSNTGMSNTGMSNTGMSNTGMSNTGMSNTGISNTGMSNTGMSNTGMSNTGMSNTGMSNTRMSNTGMSNTGMSNTGMSNTGVTNSAAGTGVPVPVAPAKLTPSEQKELVALEKSVAILEKRLNDYFTLRTSSYTISDYKKDRKLYLKQKKRRDALRKKRSSK